MKVIVIGNAPSVLLNEFGSTIDTFDKVIRMNDYKISGFEKHVGTKTDIYVRSHNPEYPMKDASEYDEAKINALKSGRMKSLSFDEILKGYLYESEERSIDFNFL